MIQFEWQISYCDDKKEISDNKIKLLMTTHKIILSRVT